MTTRRFLLPFSAVALLAGLNAQTPPAASASPPPAASSAATATPPAATVLSKEQALKEIDAGLARFEVAIKAEPSPVVQAAMKTRLTVLRQRRRDLAKRYTAERYETLREAIGQDVRVENKMTPAVDPNEGKAARVDPALEAAANQAAREAALVRSQLSLHEAVNSAQTQREARDREIARREEQYHADRAAEQASQRRMDVARINADLSRLSAQIDASTVGDPNRRAELNMRLRDLEQERTRLELSAQPSTFDTLRSDIQREADRAR